MRQVISSATSAGFYGAGRQAPTLLPCADRKSACADSRDWLTLGEPPGSPRPLLLVRFADKALRAFPEARPLRGRDACVAFDPWMLDRKFTRAD